MIDEQRQKERIVEILQSLIAELINKSKVEVNPFFESYSDFEKESVLERLKNLITNGMSIDNDSISLNIKSLSPPQFIKIHNAFLQNKINVNQARQVFNSDIFLNKIDSTFISEISKIQGQLFFNDNEIAKIIFIISKSISALKYAINPDSFIINHRKIDKQNKKQIENMNKLDRELFIYNLFDRINYDFNNQVLHEYYYTDVDIQEIETNKRVVLKSKKEIILKGKMKKRLGISKVGPQNGGGFIMIQYVNDGPEPWERLNI